MSFKDRVRIYEGKYPHVWLECKSVEQAKELVDEIEHALKLKESIVENIKHLQKLDKLAIETFGEALWKHDIRLFQSLLELSKK